MKISIIINPSSGQQNTDHMDYIYKELSKHHSVFLNYTKKFYDAKTHAIKSIEDECDLIIVSGGDGTVNQVVNGLAEMDSKIPLAIYPGGTSNDFASYLGIKKSPKDFLKMLEDFNYMDVDLGQVNDIYFMNVAAIGEIAGVASNTDKDLKAKLGRFAYYIDGISKLPDFFDDIPLLHIETKNTTYKIESFLLLITNSSLVGGFKQISPKAKINDGLFDVMVIKNANITDMAELSIRILSGNHIDDKNILYFQTDELTIRSDCKDLVINIDGENMGEMPIEFRVHNKKLRILTKKE